MSWLPVKDEQAIAWELRGAWGSGREVSIRLNEALHPVVPRVRGRVVFVSVTGAYALVSDGGGDPWHVPCAAVLAVRRPHFSEPLDRLTAERAEVFPGQLELLPEGR